MKFGLNWKVGKLLANVNLLRFTLLNRLLGFEYANIFMQRLDKQSIVLILRRYGAKIGIDCDIESGLIFHNCTDYTNLSIGNNCHIGKNCFFDLRGKINIEENVVISMRCSFVTHIDLNKSALSQIYPADIEDIRISNDCYLGTNATVLKGVIIGENSIIGANALVIKNVASYTIVGGVPASKIKCLKDKMC